MLRDTGRVSCFAFFSFLSPALGARARSSSLACFFSFSSSYTWQCRSFKFTKHNDAVVAENLSVVLVTRVVPNTFTTGEIEVIYLFIASLAGLPVFGQWSFQSFPCNPKEILFLFYVHAEPFRIFKDLLLGRLVILGQLLLQNDALHGAGAPSSSGPCSPRGLGNKVDSPEQPGGGWATRHRGGGGTVPCRRRWSRSLQRQGSCWRPRPQGDKSCESTFRGCGFLLPTLLLVLFLLVHLAAQVIWGVTDEGTEWQGHLAVVLVTGVLSPLAKLK
jgi:hypothetical protein